MKIHNKRTPATPLLVTKSMPAKALKNVHKARTVISTTKIDKKYSLSSYS